MDNLAEAFVAWTRPSPAGAVILFLQGLVLLGLVNALVGIRAANSPVSIARREPPSAQQRQPGRRCRPKSATLLHGIGLIYARTSASIVTA